LYEKRRRPCRRTLSEDLVGGDPEKRTAQPAQTDRRTRTINDAVVVSIPAQMVQEIAVAEPEIGGRGATTLPSDTSPTMGELINRVYSGNRGARGISVEAGETAGS
jgi:hypothetical protein